MSNKYNNKNFTTYSTKVKYVLTEQETAAFKAIGKLMAREIRKATPVASGKMKRNVGYSVRRKDKAVWIGVKSKAFYVKFVEFGHRVGNKGTGYLKKKGRGAGGKSLGNVKGYPFFEAAYRRNRDKMQEMVKDYLRELDKNDSKGT